MRKSFKDGFGAVIGILVGLIVGNEMIDVYNKLKGKDTKTEEKNDEQ